jgi:hypothetical protein
MIKTQACDQSNFESIAKGLKSIIKGAKLVSMHNMMEGLRTRSCSNQKEKEELSR